MSTLARIIANIHSEMSKPDRDCVCVEANAIDACRRFLQSVEIATDAAKSLRERNDLAGSDEIVGRLMRCADEVSNIRKRIS